MIEIAHDRNATIREIKSALQRRSGKAWSVTGGRGTAWGWITIDAPPARRTARHRLKQGMSDLPQNYEEFDSGEPGGSITPADREELARLLGLDSLHFQGASIPASSDYRREYIDRANGNPPSVTGTPYWD
jgi:hypothetical protein